MSTTATVLNVAEAAESRVSIRKYTDEPIPRELIEKVLDAARRAPSPWNIQPWRVWVVSNPELKLKLQEAAYGQPQVGAAASVLIVASDMTDALAKADDFIHPGMAAKKDDLVGSIRANFEKMGEEASRQWGFAESNIFLGYLLLALEAYGIGSSPMLGFDPAKVRELLDLPEHVTFPALVAIGFKAEEGFSQFRHPIDRFTTYLD